MKKIIYLTLLICIASLLFCNFATRNTKTNDLTDENTETLNILTTTTMLLDLATVIGGENATVSSLMGVGVDPHLYKASALDLQKIQSADIILYHGHHLEGAMGDVFKNLLEQGKTVICLEDGVDYEKLLLVDGEIDPHIWFDVSLWADCAVHIFEGISKYDEANLSYYSENLAKYLSELSNLLEYVQNQVQTVPENQRVLITAHDAFNYFGNAYDFEVYGLQGISTESEIGTADVIELTDFIVTQKIKAIFIETSMPYKNIEAVVSAVKSHDFNVEIGGELFSDSLGDGAYSSYIETVKYNVDTIVSALK